MEMREKQYKEMGQEINLKEFEKFINFYEKGLAITNSKGNTIFKTVEEIEEELNLDTIDKIYYIEENDNLKILFTNGCISMMTGV
jgi:Fe-S oxidoreductase